MEGDSTSVSFSSVVEGAAAIVAVGFVISVVYDWGFVRALNLDFASLPTTTADHFRSGLLWFPPLLVVVLAYTAIEFQFQRVERGLSEKEIVESSKNPETTRKFREGPWRLIAWTAPIFVVSYVLIGDAFASMLPMALSITWMGFAEWCYSAPLIKLRRNVSVQLAFTFLPIIGILAYFSGYNAAVDAAFRKPVEVTIERPKPLAPLVGNMLRTLENGILVVSDAKSIQYLPWNQVEAIVHKKTYKPFRGVLCEWLNLCSSSERISDKPVQPTAGSGD